MTMNPENKSWLDQRAEWHPDGMTPEEIEVADAAKRRDRERNRQGRFELDSDKPHDGATTALGGLARYGGTTPTTDGPRMSF